MMLKAYDFSKYKGAGSMSRINSFNGKENEIAQRLVAGLQNGREAENFRSDSVVKTQKDQKNDNLCTVCGSEEFTVFFVKWGVRYYRCQKCSSIFIKTSSDVLNAYKNNKELIQLRTSLEYQMEESENRDIVWEELVDWVKFRSFRYIGRNTDLKVIDYGNRYQGLVLKWKASGLCGEYELRESILNKDKEYKVEKADIVLYFNKLQQSLKPLEDLKEAYDALEEEGLLFFSTRIGTGFDILTLRGDAKIFPYEHVLLPSLDGLQKILREAGFQMLEYSTPGRKDIEYVCEHKEAIDPGNVFLRYMVENGDETVFSDFQRFLQKSGFSSHAQIVAKKQKKKHAWTE